MLLLYLIPITAFVVMVLGHPPVSHPHQAVHIDEFEAEDLNSFHPDEMPLHTTVLMAHHSNATPAAAQRANKELRR
ncbi:hypothetical protein B0J14DRAFT_40613 [Halenospora varia]|nr:hypothetical protein B0J14DRAFT_40613 [Halenospora varia]